MSEHVYYASCYPRKQAKLLHTDVPRTNNFGLLTHAQKPCLNYFEGVGERFLLATGYNLKLNLLTSVSIRILNLNNQSTSTTIDDQQLIGKSYLADPLPTAYIVRRSLITGTCQFVRNCYVVECCIQEFRRVKNVCRKNPGKCKIYIGIAVMPRLCCPVFHFHQI